MHIIYHLQTHVFTQRSVIQSLLYFWAHLYPYITEDWMREEENNYCLRTPLTRLNNVFILQATGPCWIVGRKGWLNRRGSRITMTAHSKQTDFFSILSNHINFDLKMVPFTKKKTSRENGHTCQPKSTDSVLWARCLRAQDSILLSGVVWTWVPEKPWEENPHPFNSHKARQSKV